MGKDEYIQLKADEDDCVYMFNPEKGVAKKVCGLIAAEDYPPSIIRQIRELKKNAARLPDVWVDAAEGVICGTF